MFQPDKFKKSFNEAFSKYFDSNFSKVEKYIDYDIKVFYELESTLIQQYKCLITESYIASITLTNHILERLLKLALIKNYIGLKPAKDIQTFATMFKEPHRLYSDKHLAHTLDHCRKEGLITQVQKDFLFDYIRETIRNGFSHSDTDKVFKAAPDESLIYHQNLTEPINPKPMMINMKLIPDIQSIHLFDFAKDAAPKYFDYVFELMKSIEQELLNRNK
jgi:hypothetical protein